MASWNFLTNHGRALLCIARDPDVRLREIAANLAITERRAHDIVNELAEGGYVVKMKDGRRNRYKICVDLPLPDPTGQQRSIGEVVALLAAPEDRRQMKRRSTD